MTIKREPRLYALKEADYAGRCDILAECSGSWNGVVLEGTGVLDWKSSNEPKDPLGYREWGLQDSAYRKGAEQTYDLPSLDFNATVRLDKLSGLPSVYDHTDRYEALFSAFGDLCRYYRKTYPEDYEKGIPSVTTVNGVLAKNALIPWAARLAGEFVQNEVDVWAEMSTETGIPPELVKTWAEDAKRYYRRMSKTATDIGKDVHKLIELDLKKNQQPSNMAILDPQLEQAWLAYLKFKDAINLKVLKIEFQIYGSVE